MTGQEKCDLLLQMTA